MLILMDGFEVVAVVWGIRTVWFILTLFDLRERAEDLFGVILCSRPMVRQS